MKHKRRVDSTSTHECANCNRVAYIPRPREHAQALHLRIFPAPGLIRYNSIVQPQLKGVPRLAPTMDPSSFSIHQRLVARSIHHGLASFNCPSLSPHHLRQFRPQVDFVDNLLRMCPTLDFKEKEETFILEVQCWTHPPQIVDEVSISLSRFCNNGPPLSMHQKPPLASPICWKLCRV